MTPITHHPSLVTRLSTWLASALLTTSLLGVFALVGTIDMLGVESDEIEQAPEYHRIAVDISGCTPPRWISVTPIVEVTIESSSDLGVTAIGCTRFALKRAMPIQTSRIVLSDDKIVSGER